MKLPIHVVIASVPWREKNLLELVEDVKKQRVDIASIHIILDGYEKTPDIKGVTFSTAQPSNSGGGWHRFRYITENIQGLVAIIDDDFRIEKDYLYRLQRCMERHPNSIVSWHSPTVKIFQADKLDRRVDSIGAGMCMFHTNQIEGMCKDPDTYSMVSGDEVFLSYWAWSRGISMWRCVGETPATSDDIYALDKRSIRRAGVSRRQLVNERCLQRGWPADVEERIAAINNVIVYYSEGSMPPEFQRACLQEFIRSVPEGMQIRFVVPSSLSQMIEHAAFDKNYELFIHESEKRGLKDLFERVAIAVEDLPDDIGAYFAEHDVLYGIGHFVPFKPQHAIEIPSEPGWRFNVELGHYRRAPGRILSSMRGRVGAIKKWAATGSETVVEPEATAVPWKANLVDLRWGGNFTNGPRMGAIETPGAWPEPLNLRDWVLRFVPAPVNVRERPLDVVVQTPQPAVQAWRTAPKHPQGSMLSINARGHRAKPAPKPPKPARVVPKTVGRSQSNDLTFLLERRLNRYKKNG